MNSSKANIAGLASIQQQSELKSILNGTWPPLKPLPVFRYETPGYRAKIDFDRMRGEWVCRKISLPSNSVQELRGELREITLALPHGDAETLIGDAEPQEQESVKDAHRRLQAIGEWKETCQSGIQYFELRNYLSESQRGEIDDSLRLSLTARQLQFTPKNIAYVYDALSTAGGRFATLIEFAKRAQEKQSALQEPQAAGTSAAPIALDQNFAGHSPGPDEPPAVLVRDVLLEQYQAPLLEQIPDAAAGPSAIDSAERVYADPAMLDEGRLEEVRPAPPFTGIALEIPTGPSSADRAGEPSRRSPVLQISALHVVAFASIVLFVAIAFAVGLTVGRGPLGSRLREFAKSALHLEPKPLTQPDRATEAPPQIPAPAAVASSSETARSTEFETPTTSEEVASKEDAPSSQPNADRLSADSSSSVAPDSRPFAEAGHPPKTARVEHGPTNSPAPSESDSPQRPPRHQSRASTMLVDVPVHRSQPYRVNFPERPLAATRAFAVSSQLSIFIPSDRGRVDAGKPARIEAGELVTFVAPRYPKPKDGFARVIQVRVTIGPAGQVRDVKFLSGSTFLLTATMRAVRQWRYTPTLLDKKPVSAQQDLTIEFRPPQSPRKSSTPHPTQKLVAVN